MSLQNSPIPASSATLHSKAQDRVFTSVRQQKKVKNFQADLCTGVWQTTCLYITSRELFNSSSMYHICYSVSSAVQVTTTSRQPSINYTTVTLFYTEHSVISQCFSYLCVCSKLWSRDRYHRSYFRAQFTCCFGFLCSDRFWTSDRGGRWLLLSLGLSLLTILHLPVL